MKRIAIFALALLISLSAVCVRAFANVAYPGEITVYDGDGTAIRAVNHGDESFSYLTDPNGDLIVRDNSGRYRYVVRSGAGYALGERVSGATGGARVNAREERASLKAKLYALYDALAQSAIRLRATSSISPITQSYDYRNDPLAGKLTLFSSSSVSKPAAIGECPLLVLKVQFDDIKCLFDDRAWHERAFVNGIADYYARQSGGRFTFKPVDESYGTVNDGVVCVTLPIDMPTYDTPTSGNQNSVSGSHTGIYTDGTSNYAIYNSSSLFAYGVAAAADYIDFSLYDSNGDGYVSLTELSVLVVVAGFEGSYRGAPEGSPTVWAHYWMNNNMINGTPPQQSIGALSIALDGVKLYEYAMIGENWSMDYSYTDPDPDKPALLAQIGSACHELGHALGLQDLYNVAGGFTTWEVKSLSLMGEGNWGYDLGMPVGSSPTNLDPYSKQFLGFYTPTTISLPGAYPVYAASDASRYNILRVNTDDPDVYYLIENRTYTGYDKGLNYLFSSQFPGGVVYWRIDEELVRSRWASNALNTTDDHYAIMPVYVPRGQYDPVTPFRNSRSYSQEPLHTVRRAPKTTLAVYDLTAPSMEVHLTVDSPKPPATTPPVTGDSEQPVLWIVLLALSAALVAWLLLARKHRKP